MKQLGGPDLAVAGDQVGDILRGRPSQLDGMENALQVVAVPVETGEVKARRLRRQQRFGDDRVPDTQRGDFAAITVVLAFRKRNEAQQRIGDATAGGQNNAQPLRGQGVEDGCDAAEAVSVGDARPSELVYDPGFGRSLIDSHRIGAKN